MFCLPRSQVTCLQGLEDFAAASPRLTSLALWGMELRAGARLPASVQDLQLHRCCLGAPDCLAGCVRLRRVTLGELLAGEDGRRADVYSPPQLVRTARCGAGRESGL